jgi:hypothetical protein
MHSIFLATALLLGASLSNGIARDLRTFWMSPPYPSPEPQDTQTAFRGSFELAQPAEVELRILGVSWFNAWLDGEHLTDGPARFPRAYPEYDVRRIHLAAGRHVLAVQVHYAGVNTRIMDNVPPFLACEVSVAGQPVEMVWRSLPLPGVRATSRRRSPLQGWMEWMDTRPQPVGWKQPGFDDSQWRGVAPSEPGIGPVQPISIGSVSNRILTANVVARGPLARTFAPDTDDPVLAFFTADLECKTRAPQGEWRRYDLGKVRIARPRFVLDVPAGAVVKFGSSEELLSGRVAPWSALSGSPTCFVDHYIARGGEQEFFPLQSQGARFFEVQVFAPRDQVRFVREEFVERAYLDEPSGEFRCGDALLERIWRTGIETLRSSCEDAMVDSRRERGQWTGDLFVGMRIMATSYPDLRLARRGLVQSAQCARPDGLVAALCPGMNDYIPGYSALWVGAVLDYWEMTGDRASLTELFPAAERNVGAMLARLGPSGITNGLAWNFVDWGYVPNPGEFEVVCNLQILEALRAMMRWCGEVGRDSQHYVAAERQLASAMQQYFDHEMAGGGDVWGRIGYQRAVFGLRTGLLRGEPEQAAVKFIKAYISQCFPGNPAGAQLSDPYIEGEFFTPYFANLALPELVRRGEMDFVLEQYRRCWGWVLNQGLTTWPEVFDTRWSHCHQWSGSPTWMLSRHVLGLHPRFDLGSNHFELNVNGGSLQHAAGKVALRDGSVVSVSWKRDRRGHLKYEISSDSAVVLHLEGEAAPIEVRGKRTLQLAPSTPNHHRK